MENNLSPELLQAMNSPEANEFAAKAQELAATEEIAATEELAITKEGHNIVVGDFQPKEPGKVAAKKLSALEEKWAKEEAEVKEKREKTLPVIKPVENPLRKYEFTFNVFAQLPKNQYATVAATMKQIQNKLNDDFKVFDENDKPVRMVFEIQELPDNLKHDSRSTTIVDINSIESLLIKLLAKNNMAFVSGENVYVSGSKIGELVSTDELKKRIEACTPEELEELLKDDEEELAAEETKGTDNGSEEKN